MATPHLRRWRLCRQETLRCAGQNGYMDRRDHQAIRYRQGLSCIAPPLGRRTHMRVAGPLPPSRQGLGEIYRKLHRMGAHRFHPHAHSQNRKILLSLRYFRIGHLAVSRPIVVMSCMDASSSSVQHLTMVHRCRWGASPPSAFECDVGKAHMCTLANVGLKEKSQCSVTDG